MSQSDLFPSITPYEQGYLPVDETHQIYWEESGAPGGKPVLFLHGGPGSGASPDHRRFFNPEKCRIVIFDQRGAGRSKPLGETKNNSTQHLIADIEELRQRRGIEKWLVFGGSWGSTLALAYAQAHPERVAALVLRGIFLCRQMEIDWFLYGMRWVFPEEWRKLVEPLSEAERGDILSAYHKKLMDPDPAVHLPAARIWSAFEGATSTLLPSASTVDHFSQDQVALGLARLEAHYFINRIFMEEGALLKGVDRIRHIPAFIAQGRYDMVCPIRSADDLVQAWPQARYQVIPDAGHSAMEPGTRRALVAATADFVERIDW